VAGVQLRRRTEMPAREAAPERRDPRADARFAGVDLSTTSDQADDDCPVCLPIQAEIKYSGSDWTKPLRPLLRAMNDAVCSSVQARRASSKIATCSGGGYESSRSTATSGPFPERNTPRRSLFRSMKRVAMSSPTSALPDPGTPVKKQMTFSLSRRARSITPA
jgi:hypothetical protein